MPLNHVLIIGAGLAGPALAIALAKQSIKSTILERRPYSTDIGGVIMLAPNAMRVIENVLQMGPPLREKGYPFDAIDIYTEGSAGPDKAGGFTLANNGLRALSIGRPVLHDALLSECKNFGDLINLRYGAKMVKVEETPDEVAAVLEDGTRITGDVMIGADGIGSLVRQHVLGGDGPTSYYSGTVSISAIVQRKDLGLPPSFKLPAFTYTRHGTFLAFAIDPSSETIQWATTRKVPERNRKEWAAYKTSGQALAEIREEYAGVTAEPIRSMIGSLTNDNILVWAPYEVPSLPTWHSDRCCLLGDAAHAIPPSAGQGAAQAFEDVGLLARLLSSPVAVDKGYSKLFSHFEKARKVRVEMIRKMTAGAESTRDKTGSGVMWWLKSKGIGVGLSILGFRNGGYLSGSKVFSYDVMAEDIAVN